MPKRLLRLPPTLLAALAFGVASVVMLGVAFAAALVIEGRTDTVLTSQLAEAEMPWVEVETDGLQVILTRHRPGRGGAVPRAEPCRQPDRRHPHPRRA